MAKIAKPVNARPRLGRGLSSLIVNSAEMANDDKEYQHVTGLPPIAPAQAAATPQSPPQGASNPQEIPIDSIAPNPFQPRRQFSEEELRELADSVVQQGILQPLIVASGADPIADHPYVLIAGERRLRAARLAGLQTVPCVVRQATRQQMLEWALVENIQRADLNPLERANAYRDFMDRFNLTQAQIAERVGQPRPTVSNYLRLLDLCDELQQMLITGHLTFGHAKVLGSLAGSPQRQVELARKIASDGLSVRQVEGMLAAELAVSNDGGPLRARPRRERLKPSYVRDLEERLTAAVGTRVAIHPGRAKHSGRIVIDYYSLDDFDRIAGLLGVRGDGGS